VRVIKQLLINVSGENVSGAILEDGRLYEVFSEEIESIRGNIYLGKVEKIVPALDAAFVNIGKGKNAFLRLRDLTKTYIDTILGGKKIAEGDKILVQVKKDAVGNKGPQVTTKLSLAGHFLVFFPLSKAKGISKKIVDKDERNRLKNILKNLLKEGYGVVLRTASEGVGESEILEEYEEMKREWEDILKKFKRSRKPKILREEPETLDFILRERLDGSVNEVVVNDLKAFEKISSYISKMPKRPSVNLARGDIFDEYGIYDKLKELNSKVVDLENGGSIVIEVTEAMTVIDVNSSAYIEAKDQRELSLNINLEAAKEICRQMRLRNIGGIIIIDFITMEYENDRRKVLETLKKELLKDKAKTEVLGFTRLGLLEMTRKRTSPPHDIKMFAKCPVCGGTGKVLSPKVIRDRLENELRKFSEDDNTISFFIRVHRNLSGYLNSENLKLLRKRVKKNIEVSFDWPDPNTYDLKLKRR